MHLQSHHITDDNYNTTNNYKHRTAAASKAHSPLSTHNIFCYIEISGPKVICYSQKSMVPVKFHYWSLQLVLVQFRQATIAVWASFVLGTTKLK